MRDSDLLRVFGSQLVTFSRSTPSKLTEELFFFLRRCRATATGPFKGVEEPQAENITQL